ncbi:MAG TPA: N-acetyltransferase, partial [Chloroflexi bacterium]|nr:N-acetyltransferase [Chloroflexota bacterium]
MTGIEFPQLETERLVLREHRLLDQEAVFSVFSDEAVTRHYLVTPFTEMIQAEQIVQSRIDRFYAGTGIRWAITRRGEGALLGSCGFFLRPARPGLAELGYELARPYWNQGIMTEALRACLTYAFTVRGLSRIEAQILPENEASRRVLEKLGFRWAGLREKGGYLNGRH